MYLFIEIRQIIVYKSDFIINSELTMIAEE